MNRTLASCIRCDSSNANIIYKVNPNINKIKVYKNEKYNTIENNTTLANSTNIFLISKTINELNNLSFDDKKDELEVIEYPYKNYDLYYKQTESSSSSIIEDENDFNTIKKVITKIKNNTNSKVVNKNCRKKIHNFLKKGNKIIDKNNIKKKKKQFNIKNKEINMNAKNFVYKSQNIKDINTCKRMLDKLSKRSEYKADNIDKIFLKTALKTKRKINKFIIYKNLSNTKEKNNTKKTNNKTSNYIDNDENIKNEKLNEFSYATDNCKNNNLRIPLFTKNVNPFTKIY